MFEFKMVQNLLKYFVRHIKLIHQFFLISLYINTDALFFILTSSFIFLMNKSVLNFRKKVQKGAKVELKTVAKEVKKRVKTFDSKGGKNGGQKSG